MLSSKTTRLWKTTSPFRLSLVTRQAAWHTLIWRPRYSKGPVDGFTWRSGCQELFYGHSWFFLHLIDCMIKTALSNIPGITSVWAGQSTVGTTSIGKCNWEMKTGIKTKSQSLTTRSKWKLGSNWNSPMCSDFAIWTFPSGLLGHSSTSQYRKCPWNRTDLRPGVWFIVFFH